MICKECGAKLTADDTGAFRRFWDRESPDFVCIPCLCGKLKCSEAYLRERIEFLRKSGCAMFPDRAKKNGSE